MKKGKRVKPRFPIEYRLLITPKYKEREKKTVTLVALRTVNEFTNFLYEIIVQDSMNDNTMHLKIQGLRAPQVSLPGMGPAKFKKEYDGLSGTFTVIVTKLDREENVFVVDISTQNVALIKGPKTKFVEVVTEENDW
jgi:hypothetical protein